MTERDAPGEALLDDQKSIEGDQRKRFGMSDGATLRCKLRVSEVTVSRDAEGKATQERVTLDAVYSPDPESENAQWAKYTPSARFQMTIDNPAAFGHLSNGHEFYVDFIPAAVAEAAP